MKVQKLKCDKTPSCVLFLFGINGSVNYLLYMDSLKKTSRGVASFMFHEFLSNTVAAFTNRKIFSSI
jgi:hypothetical protein